MIETPGRWLVERRVESAPERPAVAACHEMIDPHDEMGVTLWYFPRPHPGELRPVPRAAVEAFFSGDRRLLCDEQGLVRFVEVIVQLQDRMAVEVTRAFPQYRALPDGTVDRDHITRSWLWLARQ